MKTSIQLPIELEGFQRDAKAEARFPIRRRLLVIATFVGLPLGCGATLHFGGWQPATVGLLFSGGCFAGWIAYKLNAIRPTCQVCSKRMHTVLAHWSFADYLDIKGKKPWWAITGADGYLYICEPPGDVRTHEIRAVTQRWYACPSCRSCFLGDLCTVEHVVIDAENHREQQSALEELKTNSRAIEDNERYSTTANGKRTNCSTTISHRANAERKV